MKKILLFLAVVSLYNAAFTGTPATADDFDYSVYNALLRRYVSDGKIDYIAWKKRDMGSFGSYIESLKGARIDGMTADEEKAFWINAYNALTIYGVLRHIPEKRFMARWFSVRFIPGFFDSVEHEVAGDRVTLDEIENVKLRGSFKDARIHFAIVCASRSCPAIQPVAFTGGDLDARLESSAKAFIRDTEKNRLDRDAGILYLSQIFKWFRGDFVKDSGSVLMFVRKYLDEENSNYLAGHNVRIKFLYYDWLVNID